MLYNPKWETTIKSDPFSLDSLIAWLERQAPDAQYDWTVAESCLLGRWCASKGLKGRELRNMSITLGSRHRSGAIAEVALGDPGRCTFGAALARARAFAVWREGA